MKKFLLIILCCAILSGCATSTKVLKRVSLDMTKEEVVKKMGEPIVVRGAIKNKYNQTIEVWEYELSPWGAGEYLGGTALSVVTFGIFAPVVYQEHKSGTKNYWLYFYDGKLVQWGQAGDWRREADRIYEINFDTGAKLTQ